MQEDNSALDSARQLSSKDHKIKRPKSTSQANALRSSIQSIIGLPKDVYKGIQEKCVRVAPKYIDVSKTWRSNTKRQKKTFVEKIVESFDCLRQYEDIWPIELIMTRILWQRKTIYKTLFAKKRKGQIQSKVERVPAQDEHSSSRQRHRFRPAPGLVPYIPIVSTPSVAVQRALSSSPQTNRHSIVPVTDSHRAPREDDDPHSPSLAPSSSTLIAPTVAGQTRHSSTQPGGSSSAVCKCEPIALTYIPRNRKSDIKPILDFLRNLRSDLSNLAPILIHHGVGSSDTLQDLAGLKEKDRELFLSKTLALTNLEADIMREGLNEIQGTGDCQLINF
ncbi:hypothetical protein C8Q75DRAFT_888507 [Abortiporus biennis]|nr:hypothetical protein C8Q75DRAFT_888507 [Abortiporus biennis]